MGTEITPLPLYRGTINISGSVGFQSGRAFAGQRALTIESLLMSEYGQGYEPTEIVSI